MFGNMGEVMIGWVDVVLGKRLRARRKLLGMTQLDVANVCGLSFQQIQKYENAVNKVSAATLWELSRALRVEMTYFYDGLSDMNGVRQSVNGARREMEAASLRIEVAG
jgi:transcriptional regulator with XRE-family HTH domain